jgi:hypothetical protein
LKAFCCFPPRSLRHLPRRWPATRRTIQHPQDQSIDFEHGPATN